MALNINNNLMGLNAQRQLIGANRAQSGALQRLSSGLRINQGKDGPADLMISEFLRGEINGLSQALRNTQEANNVLGIAEGGLSGISSQLLDARSLVTQAQNTGTQGFDQVAALQSQLDSLVSTIYRTADTTRFSGQSLLNGASSVTFSANDPDEILDVGASRIDEVADIAGLNVAIEFSGDVADQAERATLETDFGGGTTLATDQQFTLTGEQGSAEFTFGAGTDLQTVADAINNRSDSTGVQAYVTDSGTELRLASDEYGTDAVVQVSQTTGDAFAAEGETARDTGQDLTVTVDGQRLTGNGLALDVNTANVSGTLAFSDAADGVAQTGYDQDSLADVTDASSAQIGDIQGGMRFQLGGGAGEQNRGIFSIGSFNPANIGRVEVGGESYSLRDVLSGGGASLANNPGAAAQVIEQAIADVSSARGRIGAFQANTLQTNVNSLRVAQENVTATESFIRDANIATEVTEKVRTQILERAGILGIQSANASMENVLRLLGA